MAKRTRSDTTLLRRAADALLKIDCQFLPCPGVNGRNRSMLTCRRCWALNDIYRRHPEWKPKEDGA